MAQPDFPPLDIDGLTDAVVIGTGGFATVYRARQPAFGRSVAVKVLDARLDAEGTARFARECQALGAVSAHPHIVDVYEGGITHGGRPFLVLEFLPGGSLQDRVDRAPLPWDEATALVVQLAGALETAHRAGIVHRDVKPGNVAVSAFGEVQLTDFGIARLDGAHETRSGVVTASMAHAPPEVLDGSRPGPTADVYSLASTLFELIAGHAPFARPGEASMLPMLRRTLDDPAPDLRDAGAPASVAAVVTTALAKDPGERPATAEAFGRALQEARRAEGRDPGRLVLARVSDPEGPAPAAGATARPSVADAAATVHVPARSPVDNRTVAGSETEAPSTHGDAQPDHDNQTVARVHGRSTRTEAVVLRPPPARPTPAGPRHATPVSPAPRPGRRRHRSPFTVVAAAAVALALAAGGWWASTRTDAPTPPASVVSAPEAGR